MRGEGSAGIALHQRTTVLTNGVVCWPPWCCTVLRQALYYAALHYRYSKLGLKFQMYTDPALRTSPDCDLSHVKFLIISPESLCLIKALRPKYSFVIVDESESTLAQFSSSTMTKLNTRQPESWSTFMRVCSYADKLLFLDGHASNRSVSTLQAIYAMKKAQESSANPSPASTGQVRLRHLLSCDHSEWMVTVLSCMQPCHNKPCSSAMATSQPPFQLAHRQHLPIAQLPGSLPSHPWVPCTKRRGWGLTATLQCSLQAAQPPLAATQLPGSLPSHPWVPCTKRRGWGLTAALQPSLHSLTSTC
jgi:hypothetical protein